MLTFHSFRALGSTYLRLRHRLPESFNADAISSLHFFLNRYEKETYILDPVYKMFTHVVQHITYLGTKVKR